MRLIDRYLNQVPTRTLYHYTDAAGLIGILHGKSIWASSVRHLNDPQEYKYALKLMDSELARRTSGLGKLYDFPLGGKGEESPLGTLRSELHDLESRLLYVASFSEKKDDLSQWRAYCGSYNGYSIGFEPGAFQALGGYYQLVKCVYGAKAQSDLCRALIDSYMEIESEHRTAGPIRRAAMRIGWGTKFLPVAAALKPIGFRDEAEWRLVAVRRDRDAVNFRPGRLGLVPYINVPLAEFDGKLRVRELVVGPSGDRQASRIAAEKIMSKYAAGRLEEETNAGRRRKKIPRPPLITPPGRETGYEYVISDSSILYRT